jgi:hypothetical protein
MLRRLYGDAEVSVPPELAEKYRAALAPLGITARRGEQGELLP